MVTVFQTHDHRMLLKGLILVVIKATANLFESKKKSKRIQCRECEGFGHILSEYANTLKKKYKSLISTWSDEESKRSQ